MTSKLNVMLQELEDKLERSKRLTLLQRKTNWVKFIIFQIAAVGLLYFSLMAPDWLNKFDSNYLEIAWWILLAGSVGLIIVSFFKSHSKIKFMITMLCVPFITFVGWWIVYIVILFFSNALQLRIGDGFPTVIALMFPPLVIWSSSCLALFKLWPFRIECADRKTFTT